MQPEQKLAHSVIQCAVSDFYYSGGSDLELFEFLTDPPEQSKFWFQLAKLPFLTGSPQTVFEHLQSFHKTKPPEKFNQY